MLACTTSGETSHATRATAIHIEVIHRAPGLAVVNKPTGVSLLADRSGSPSLWDLLPDALGDTPRLVHRLDKGTSGVLLVALNLETQRRLTRAFRQRRIRKYYLTRVVGRLDSPGAHSGTLTIDLPLRKGRKSRYRVAGARADISRTAHGWSLRTAGRDAHPSQTRIRVLQRQADHTLLLAAPLTGRTHQLRVHLAWIGHPILGDHLYGRPGAPEQRAPRLELHCHRLVVPGYGSFSAPV